MQKANILKMSQMVWVLDRSDQIMQDKLQNLSEMKIIQCSGTYKPTHSILNKDQLQKQWEGICYCTQLQGGSKMPAAILQEYHSYQMHKQS